MIDPHEALRLVLEVATERPPRTVSLAAAAGLVLAQDVAADRPYPPFPRATMDGYAVRAVDAGAVVRLVGEVAAGQQVSTELLPGHCLEIMTGARCPPGAEAVVQREHAQRSGDWVTLPRELSVGQNVAPQGSECHAGQLVLHSGQTITPLAVAVLASFGLESVAVIPRPSLAIVTTGAELVPPGERPGPGRIRDSNGPMLRAMARELGIEPPPQLHADDRLEEILHALDATAEADLVLVTGGVSAGKYDLVPDALAAYGARQVFHRVSQKPGRPLLLARRGSQVIFGLPGNPLSCHFCFHRYVSAAVGQMQGRAAPVEPPRGRLAAAAEPRPTRTHFIPARAEHVAPAGAAPDQWQLDPLPAASSADVFTCSRANCYLEAPPGRAPIPAGQVLPFTWLAGSPTA